MIKAIIDLGSNTFHLLIAEIRSNEVKIILKKRLFVGLADGGIDIIREHSIQKGIEALKEFRLLLDENKHQELIVTGTAALRSASNASEFIVHAEKILGTKVTIIDGLKEAELIYRGASLLTDMSHGYHMIMDIGGGSTEFIIVHENKMIWSHSYQLGVGVMHSMFQKSDPISYEDESALRAYLRLELTSLKQAAAGKDFKTLVGASGSFEVLETMTGHPVSISANRFINIEDFNQISKQIVKAGYQERLQMKGLPENRVKLIVVAMILIEEILEIIDPDAIQVTPYALKEGILAGF